MNKVFFSLDLTLEPGFLTQTLKLNENYFLVIPTVIILWIDTFLVFILMPPPIFLLIFYG
ncbi:hypothetical protein COZ82_01520 [Candidatus Kaiserbacteria bacterium CG_4_8_14_3_um_filter_38_9]|uniref:Uncharacterized protein n=1 Tax=Candidatus Kaiserbacteria bacterium CG_4_8_14_3_um_filter_38_9 TaxID=1974599 RepID=A0A2M7IP85_9BACT|nr:MAG: hypothetical protein COZ82_01520 [Candidatus Kaiserbacteria bacterium CG_4_8_14_3_um_filter_38_9]